MDNSVSRLAFEATISMTERTIRRLWILCLVLVFLLLATNGAWMWYESRFEERSVTTEVKQDNADGINNFIGNDGDITNGETND